jgi:ATP-binding cassette, subfamily C (CFTR/MRP), member 1
MYRERVTDNVRSVDVERICQGAEFFHEMWASVLAVALAIIIIYNQVG